MPARGKTARKDGAAATAAPAPFPHYGGRLSPRSRFLSRVRRAATYALLLVGATLAIGIAGYHAFAGLSWLDAFHQAALLLSGMGPVADIPSTAGKVFDGIYALFCGVVLLASTGLLLAPIFHRILHRFHLEDARDG